MASDTMTPDDWYKVVSDPGASPESLRAAWEGTKSIRVRRAVASNPNCDSKLLAMAARLYVKEVINNPSFELLNLFAEDKVVKSLYEAYQDPQTFYTIAQLPRIRNTNGDRVNIARALLVSPRLSSPRILGDICASLSGAEFSRELKDPDVMDRVKAVADKGVKDGLIGLHSLLFLFHHSVVDIDQLEAGIGHKNMMPGMYFTSKGMYVKFVKERIRDGNYPLLFKFLHVNKPVNLRDLVKAVRTDPELQTDAALKLYSELYRDYVLHDVLRGRKEAESRKLRYGYYGYSRLNDECVSHHLSDLIWTTIATRTIPAQGTFEDVDLDRIFSDVKMVGFDKDIGPYRCELELGTVSATITGRLKMCERLLEMADPSALEFFATSGMLWSDWYAKGGEDSAETEVVKRLHAVNYSRFIAGKPLLYGGSRIDAYFPLITIEPGYGSDHNGWSYSLRAEAERPKPGSEPTGSGRIGYSVIDEVSGRGID